MRILLVTHYYADHGGGVEVVAGEIARRLARQGIEVVWAASGPKPAALTPGITYLPMRACNWSERWLGVPYPLWGPVGLLRLIRQVFRCDAVHLHDSLYFGNVAASLAARVAGRPVLVTQHIGLVPYRQRWLRGLMSAAVHTVGRAVLRGAAQVVFYSRSVQRYFEQLVQLRRPARYIPNGVDLDRFQPVPETDRRRLRQELGWPEVEPVMLFVGRFVEKKGLTRLRGLAGRFPQTRWVLIGWGPEDPRRWNLPNVTCLGPIEHERLACYYQAADLLVLPSVGEGFPLVVQEAMACGTPALVSAETAAAMPGVEEVAFVAQLDDASLDAAVRGMLSSPELLALRREASAQFARQHWNWDACARAYRELFQELAGTSG
jgi:glycosyltransferase involved in cell wall biosynthesis